MTIRDLLLPLAAALAAIGCAAPTALRPGDQAVEVGDGGVVLLTVHVANTLDRLAIRSRNVWVARVLNAAEQARIDEARADGTISPAETRASVGGGVFPLGEPVAAGGVPGASWEQRLAAIRLPAGRFEIALIGLEAGSYPVVASGVARVNAYIQVTAGSANYLGRIIVKRRGRASPTERSALEVNRTREEMFVGLGEGVTEVSVKDALETDLEAARALYPALRGMEFQKALLSPAAQLH